MTRHSLIKLLALTAGSFVVPRIVFAEEYLSLDQAQKSLISDGKLDSVAITLTKEQKKAIEQGSGERVRNLKVNAWRGVDGSWFIVDEVLGKHEFITYAVAISKNGAVKGIEIMTYRETYGHEIKLPKWRAQFTGKTASAPLKIDTDIKNIAGATLSCVHVTDGVRRLLQTWSLVLSKVA
jgi:Na+-transporting NADH:ubiquinone oxidoreductase subunit NqrC